MPPSPFAAGARVLPSAHLSMRVPWHDTDWTGRVCEHPRENTACMILKSINEGRQVDAEHAIKGKPFAELDETQLPPCVKERVSFLNPHAATIWERHAYATTSKLHGHFARTPVALGPHSAGCIPFRWMRKKEAQEIAAAYDLDLDLEREPDLGFESIWIQDFTNQNVMLDSFYSAVVPDESLCFFYAKRTPLSEDTRRVIVGVGRVTGRGAPIEHKHTPGSASGLLRSMVWTRAVAHSLRSAGGDGVFLPYHRALSAADRDPTVDLNSLVAFAPDDAFDAFSNVGEHVSHELAIASLLSCARALENAGRVLGGDFDAPLAWINGELGRLWRMRGPFPGLGSALVALGFQDTGVYIAHAIARAQRDAGSEWNEDPWPLVDAALREPSLLGDAGSRVDASVAARWARLPDERRALLKLLARFSLSPGQASRWYVPEERAKAGISATDAQILANPYRVFEADRYTADPISVFTVDRGVFPDAVVRDKHPLAAPSAPTGAIDPRRLRALIVQDLAAAEGDTLRGRSQVLAGIRAMELSPPCPVSADDLPVLADKLVGVVADVAFSDGTPAWQLAEVAEDGAFIKGAISRRVSGRKHTGTHDWASLMVKEWGGLKPGDVDEARARAEKSAALDVLYRSRFSVLIGPAGTGKTSVLKMLCNLPEVHAGGVALLAPTGKARVRMETQVGASAKTIAQFLLPGRYDTDTGRYHRAPGVPPKAAGKTVIIDEASMLTEDQLAAVIDGIEPPDRLILVGDPRQLPPIGAGRPFVDIVRALAPADIEARPVKVGDAYAELVTTRRQQGSTDRLDLALAAWFGGHGGADDRVWARVANGDGDAHLRFVRWETEAELSGRLVDVLVEELALGADPDGQETRFEESLGGFKDERGNVYFNSTWHRPDGTVRKGAGPEAENWQILAPMRGRAHGVEQLNRQVQGRFRTRTKRSAQMSKWQRRIPEPLGPEQMIYGDKVIQNRNQPRKYRFPADKGGYVANGEIGMAVGEFKRGTAIPWRLQVEFASQPGISYSYTGQDAGEEGDPVLSLAYALTVHKSQGSEFGTVFLVLPQHCALLSRELLYTAFTRQKNRLIVLHQGDLVTLQGYSSEASSEIARRLTNLFVAPTPVKVSDRYLEEGLIHRTPGGLLVRSKSEVIVAELLERAGLRPRYEERLYSPDGGTFRLPDFTIDDGETGVVVYWEHLGMLGNERYRRRWEEKRDWFREIGVGTEGEPIDGRLLVTSEDGLDGSIDASIIAAKIKKVFGR